MDEKLLSPTMLDDEEMKTSDNIFSENNDLLFLLHELQELLDKTPESEGFFNEFKQKSKFDARFNDNLDEALLGNKTGQFNIGRMFYENQNYIGALFWYSQAAANGDTKSINNIALMYYNGEGLTKDEYNAQLWFEAGIKRNNRNCKTNLAIILTKANYDPSRTCDSRNYSYAVKLFQSVADNSSTDKLALNNLGCYYCRGFGIEVDYNKAMKLFKKASETGSLVAKYNMAILYYNGYGVKQNTKKALKYFEAIENNYRHSEYKCLDYINHDPTKFVFFTSLVPYTASAE